MNVDAMDRDADLRETAVASESVWRGGFLDVRCDQVRLPDGSIAQREYIVHPGAVVVVALLGDERVVVERQWRHPMRRAMLELPAGKLDAGEDSLRCAVRELREETGYRAAQWARAGVLHNAIAYSTEAIAIWFARGLVAGQRKLDAGEFLEVGAMTQQELEAAALRGELTDAKTLIGLLWLRNVRSGLWTLDWRDVATDAAADNP